MNKIRLSVALCVIAFATSGQATTEVTCTGSLWSVEGSDMNQDLGKVVTTLSDVNGDGFADLLVGVPNKGGALPVPHSGEAYVYYGSASGLPLSPSKMLTSGDFRLGLVAAAAGDVNRDGYDDLILGDNGYAGVSAALVYFGAAAGLPDAPSWVALGPPDENPAGANAGFAKAVSSAGDVNGDGFDDVLIRDYDADNGDALFAGRVYVFFGGPNGLSNNPDQVLRGQTASGGFGYGASSAGDINADGFSDVIISEPGYPTTEGAGRAFVLFGGPLGLIDAPGWTTDSKEGFGVERAVGTAGDVNGDGFADIIVGQRAWPAQGRGRFYTGRAAVYFGSPAGPSSSPNWIVTGKNGSYLGDQAVTAGDVNGDGFGDVVVSAPGFSDPSQGKFFVYLGSHGGLDSKPALVVSTNELYGIFAYSLSSADTNGDGRSEVIMGDPGHDNASYTILDLGQACLFAIP